MKPMANPVRKSVVQGTMILLMLSGVASVCVAGGLDWLLPPLRTPCAGQTAPPPVVSTQTTYTPRFSWGLLGGGPEMVPAAGMSPASYGIGWSRGFQSTPVVLVPMEGCVPYGCPPSGQAYICVPYVLPHTSWFYGGYGASSPSPGVFLLPGNLPSYYGTPSTFWRPPATATSVPPAEGSLSYPGEEIRYFGGGILPFLTPPGSVQTAPGSYSIPAQPAAPVPPSPSGSSFDEKANSSARPETGPSLPAAESSPGQPTGPLVPIPDHPPPSQEKPIQENPPTLNPPNPSLKAGVGRPVQPSFTPLPRQHPLLERPGASGSGKPDPRDRTT